MSMKKLMMMALLMVISVTAKALSYETARSEALFLSDKMAYELNLSPSQYEAIYEINLDYFMCVGSKLDLYSDLWKQRNFEIQRVLTPYQYENFLRLKYFYRPLGWSDGRWEFRIYRIYPNRGHFMMNRPRAYGSYRGGRHFRGRPGGPGRVGPGPRGDIRRGGPGGPGPRGDVRRGPAPRPNQMRGNGPAPRQNQFRGNGPAPRQNQMRGGGQAPRPNQFRGGNGGNRQGGPNGTTRRTETRRMGPQSYATPQGMVQRSGRTTTTTVTTTRQFQNQRPQQAQRQQQNRRPQQAQRQQQSRPQQAQRQQQSRPQQVQRQQQSRPQQVQRPQGQRSQGQRPQQGQRPRR